MPGTDTDPRARLPLPPLEFHVLVALAGADMHGYAIVKDVAARCGMQRSPSTGSLYLAIARLLDNGLIAERERSDAPGGRRRRVYRLTVSGRRVAEAEAERLGELSRLATRRLSSTPAAGSRPGGD